MNPRAADLIAVLQCTLEPSGGDEENGMPVLVFGRKTMGSSWD